MDGDVVTSTGCDAASRRAETTVGIGELSYSAAPSWVKVPEQFSSLGAQSFPCGHGTYILPGASSVDATTGESSALNGPAGKGRSLPSAADSEAARIGDVLKKELGLMPRDAHACPQAPFGVDMRNSANCGYPQAHRGARPSPPAYAPPPAPDGSSSSSSRIGGPDVQAARHFPQAAWHPMSYHPPYGNLAAPWADPAHAHRGAAWNANVADGTAVAGPPGLQTLAQQQKYQHIGNSEWGGMDTCRWHESASAVGIVSDGGHVFTKQAGARQKRVTNDGKEYELATICMVFDSSLRCGGVHRYHFQMISGSLGPADGAGFTFDSKVRRRPIQHMSAVFLNKRGTICLRQRENVSKLPARLPPMQIGMLVTMTVNLDMMHVRFDMSQGSVPVGSADVSFSQLLDGKSANDSLRSGFFCAVVTGEISVSLH